MLSPQITLSSEQKNNVIMEKYKDIRTFDELIEHQHGKFGSESRNKYEVGAQLFIVSEMLKAARKEARLTQEQLAEKEK